MIVSDNVPTNDYYNVSFIKIIIILSYLIVIHYLLPFALKLEVKVSKQQSNTRRNSIYLASNLVTKVLCENL